MDYSKLIGWRCDKTVPEKCWELVAKARERRIKKATADQCECKSENENNRTEE